VGWRPYAPTSPFNVPIGAQPRVHPASRQIVSRILSLGSLSTLVVGQSDTPDDYAHPTFWARASDPVYRLSSILHPHDPLNGTRIRIPAAARPAGGGDGHMTVVEPDGWEYDFWQVRDKPRGGGTMRFSIGGRLRVDGSGLVHGTTAAGFGNLAGIIRAPELAAGRIDHALFVVLRCTGTGRWFGYGARPSRDRGDSSYVYPAHGGGARCDSDDEAAPPMGARLQLAMSGTQIGALPMPAWKKAILTALARYGGYVGDTGGPGFAVELESGTTYTAFGSPDPLVQFARHAVPTGGGLVRSYGDRYTFDLAGGIDWTRYLRVVAPPKP
jgi:hypothetical protein